MYYRIISFVLFFVFYSSVFASEENRACQTRKILSESSLTLLAHSFKTKDKYWIKFGEDFERIEIHLKVNNIFTISLPYFFDEYLVLTSSETKHNKNSSWFQLTVEVFERVILIGQDRMVLRANINKNSYDLDTGLWWNQYRFNLFEIYGSGMFEFTSKCNPFLKPSGRNSNSSLDVPVQNSTRNNDKPTLVDDEQNKDTDDTELFHVELRRERKISLSILVVAVVLMIFILIGALSFLFWRKKRKNNLEFLRRENVTGVIKSQYETMGHGGQCSNIELYSGSPPPVPPPIGLVYPMLSAPSNLPNYNEGFNKYESGYEVPYTANLPNYNEGFNEYESGYEVPRKDICKVNPDSDNQYVDMRRY